ncbi:unnamed protein product [Arctogadus glacialis]
MTPSPDPMFPGHIQSGEHGTPRNVGTLPDSSLPLSVLHLAVSWEGHLLVHTCLEGKDKNALHLYSVNGKHLASEPLQEQVTDMSVSQEQGRCTNQILGPVYKRY